MESSKSQDKATSTKEMLHIFCDISIKAIEMGIILNTRFDKTNWRFIMTTFK